MHTINKHRNKLPYVEDRAENGHKNLGKFHTHSS